MEKQSISSCPCCGDKSPEMAFRPDAGARKRFLDLSRKRYGGFMDGWESILSLEVLRCGRCAHLWHADCPDQGSLFEMYAARANMRGRNRADAGTPAIPGPVRRHVRTLVRLAPWADGRKPRFLDYGCGYGIWGTAADKAGFEVSCYEPVAARQIADTLPNSEIRAIGSLEELEDGAYDAINLEQVLEHVSDPVETLRQIRTFGTSNCIVRISVPNVPKSQPGFWDGFPFGGGAHILSPYEHLQGFNGVSLREAIARAGLKEVGFYGLLKADLIHGIRRSLVAFAPRLKSTTLFARFDTVTAAKFHVHLKDGIGTCLPGSRSSKKSASVRDSGKGSGGTRGSPPPLHFE